jgi:FkbM family methyltransferase
VLIQKLISRIKGKFFPSKHDLTVRQWWADGGDYELRFNYDLSEASFILDLGGYEGQWASDLFSRFKSRIVVFEPVRSFSERIKKRFDKNDSIEVIQYGLGASSRHETISLDADGSSVFKTSAKSNSEDIKIVDVKDWMEDRAIEEIDLIKINIEGGEYELLNRLIETGLIKRMKNIQVQFHRISNSSLLEMQQIQKELSKTHTPTYQYEFVWENWTQK